MTRVLDRPRRHCPAALRAVCLGLAVLLALGGCEVGGPLPKGHGDPAPSIDAAQTVAGADGAPLALTVWPANGAPRAVLLALHGFGDHAASTFGGPAPFWAEAGITVYAYDQRGFGRNASWGAWPGVEALIADFAAVAAQVRARHPDAPLTALGHSMGAGVVLAALGEGRAPQIDAAILAAPAIAGGGHVSPVSRAGAWSFAAAIPDKRWTGEGLVRFQASDNTEALQALASDPLYLKGATAREVMGLIRLMDRATAAAPAVRAPVLALHGARDEVVAEADVRAVVATLPGAAEILVYPEGWHLLFRDRQREAVWRDVRAWILDAAP